MSTRVELIALFWGWACARHRMARTSSVATMTMPVMLPIITRLRNAGWMVAVHNDYRQDGKLMTFWLFTRADETGKMTAVKGEGPTDDEALAQVFRQTQAMERIEEPSARNWEKRIP